MPGPCVFCAIIQGTSEASLILDEPEVVGFLDVHPLFVGHVLLVPRAHAATLQELEDPAPLMRAAKRVAAALEQALGAGGALLALNNKVSQSVAHVHLHVVPRTKGDGLRGFFWPRKRYASAAEREQVAGRIREALKPPSASP